MRHFIKAGVFMAVVGGAVAFGDTTILLIHQGAGGTAPQSNLTALGHTVTISIGTVPGDLSGYDQVWDLRFNRVITGAQASQFTSYLQGGGRMFVTGESVFYATQNNSVLSFLAGAGAGNVTLNNGPFWWGSQDITAAGQVVNAPNTISSISYSGTDLASTTGSGFFVTETAPGSGLGSLIGWDFGDIAGASGARMLVGFDTGMWTTGLQSGGNWIENMATYLGAPDNPIIPLPSGAAMALVGLGVIGVRRRRG